jgi:hypothetical protein
MAETAFQTQYRQDFVAGFEQNQSLLRGTTTTEVEVKGNTATFLVADSGNASAVTRGVNGMIQARGDNLSQPAVTLVEWHDLVRKTGFNIFASQGNQVAIMQKTSMSVINRKIDYDIFTELNTGTVTAGATALTASLALVMRAFTVLQLAEVPWDSNITGLITPAFYAYLMQVKEFNSREYIGKPQMDRADGAWRDKPVMFWWLNVCWVVHPRLPGVGTSAEKCFMYHKSAIGHAHDSGQLGAHVGFNEEQAYSWARSSAYMGSNLLQNDGVVVINHDGSALVAG